ncbi:DUF1993 domain-containing protein [Kaistia algarum]|uniref:DUF1993 domain-containing protein n=1 Tax=Kaistia algarum TaxID=2083279 RepID=UPI000CE836C6|nr:DUF1993 domain-containing protein [Kaistia algarum]MCX5512677.1 DUF1993 domain-containing protein [Kaistia algarum]PPE81812.1 DUF1993 domain-containing protein [Kaistia algarum]
MTFSAYEVSVPLFLRGFANLSANLEKGRAFATANGIDPDELVEARLIADMLPLSGQVQRASDTAKACAARLTGIAAPSFPDEEKTLAELEARIAKTVDFLKTVPPEAFEGAEARPITLKSRGGETHFVGRDYLFQHALPNFYFHAATAYDILRMRGVPVGKQDFLGPFGQ